MSARYCPRAERLATRFERDAGRRERAALTWFVQITAKRKIARHRRHGQWRIAGQREVRRSGPTPFTATLVTAAPTILARPESAHGELAQGSTITPQDSPAGQVVQA